MKKVKVYGKTDRYCGGLKRYVVEKIDGNNLVFYKENG